MKKLLLIILIILLTGCYDYKELNDIAIISGIGISKENDEYRVIYEVINTEANKESNNDIKKYNVEAQDKNLSNAISKANEALAKQPYFEQIKVLLITKDVNILDISDYIFRNEKFNTSFYLALCDDIDEIFDYTSVNEPNNSIAIHNLLKEINDDKITNLFDFNVDNLMQGYDIYLPYIVIDKELALKTIGIFDNNSFKRYLTNEEYRIFKYLNKVKEVPIINNNDSIKIYSSKLNYDIKDSNVTIKYDAKASINYLSNQYNLRNQNTYQDLNNLFKDTIYSEISTFINNLQKDNIDILGITKLYNTKYYKNKLDIKDIKLDYEINVDIDKAGTAFKEVK